MNLTIACVLRSGGIFDGSWVKRLQRNVARYSPKHRFVCLSDCDVPCERIALKHDWPKWWPILEVFRPGLFDGRVIYFDLANLIVDDIYPLTKGSGFITALSPPDPPPLHGNYASGAMAFDADDTEIYDRFAPQAEQVLRRLHGDQMWIEEVRPDAATFDRSLTVSYKGDCQNGLPDGAAVVFCHGRPKPPEIMDPWFRERWLADGGK